MHKRGTANTTQAWIDFFFLSSAHVHHHHAATSAGQAVIKQNKKKQQKCIFVISSILSRSEKLFFNLVYSFTQNVREEQPRALHVAQLVGDGEGGAQSVVLADAAASVWIAHRPQLGQAWSNDTSVGQSQCGDSSECLCWSKRHLPKVSHLSLALQMSCLQWRDRDHGQQNGSRASL